MINGGWSPFFSAWKLTHALWPGSPYCLRRDSTALRNMRDYSGVSSSRLEMLEQRLKSDVITEIEQFQGRILLHTETVDGQVMPVWESADKQDVASLREVMNGAAAASKDVYLNFVRIPVTSESSPDVGFKSTFLKWIKESDAATAVPRHYRAS